MPTADTQKTAGRPPSGTGQGWSEKKNPTRWLWADKPSNVSFTVTEKAGPGTPIYMLQVLTDNGMFKHRSPSQWTDKNDAFKAAAQWFKGLAGEAVSVDMTKNWSKMGSSAMTLAQRLARMVSDHPETRTALMPLVRLAAEEEFQERLLGGKVAENLPPSVERYVEEGKAQGLAEDVAWPVAWSRYCKYKNSDSPHCQKPKGDYFQGRGRAGSVASDAEGIFRDMMEQFAKMVGGKITDYEAIGTSGYGKKPGYEMGKAHVTLPMYPSISSSSPAEVWFDASTGEGEGEMRVWATMIGGSKAYEGTLRGIKALDGPPASVKGKYGVFLSSILDALRPGMGDEKRRRSADGLYRKAIPVLDKVIEKALKPLGMTRMFTSMVTGHPFIVGREPVAVISLTAEGLLSNPDRAAAKEAATNARKALSRAFRSFNVGDVQVKLSPKPAMWSAYSYNMNIFMFIEGTTIMPKMASEGDKEAIRPPPRKKDKCDGKPETYGDYRSCGGDLTEKAWLSRQRGSHAWGVHASYGYESDMLQRLAWLAMEDSTVRPHVMPLLASYSGVTVPKTASTRTARGISITKPEVMLYWIDQKTNKSKYYEMSVVPAGRETSAKKDKVWTGRGWVLMRRWGRIADVPSRSGIDSINDYFHDETQARKMMLQIKSEKTRKGYTDITRKNEYPVGLGSAGFGWGGQVVCRIIPELQTLREEMRRARVALMEGMDNIRAIAKQDSSMGQKLEGLLEHAGSDISQIVSYLDDQMAHCG